MQAWRKVQVHSQEPRDKALQKPQPELGARGWQGEGGESGRCRPDVVHLHDDIHALDHLAEHDMEAVEVGQRDT